MLLSSKFNHFYNPKMVCWVGFCVDKIFSHQEHQFEIGLPQRISRWTVLARLHPLTVTAKMLSDFRAGNTDTTEPEGLQPVRVDIDVIRHWNYWPHIPLQLVKQIWREQCSEFHCMIESKKVEIHRTKVDVAMSKPYSSQTNNRFWTTSVARRVTSQLRNQRMWV